MRQTITSFFTVLLLQCGLLFFLSACTEIAIDENEISGRGGVVGKEGNLNFVISFDSFGEDHEDISSRSAAGQAPETVVVPLGDGLSMFATLESGSKSTKTPSVALRVFKNNARINIVAYKEVASVFTYDHHVGYNVLVGGGLNSSLLRDDLHTPFSLSTGDTYKFVAYSYNDNTLDYPIPPNLPDTIDHIWPGLDLLWGESPAVYINSGYNTVTINMKHKFSKVKINATSSVGNINNIDVAMRGYTAAMEVKTGNLTARIDSVMRFTGFPTPPFNATTVSSSDRIVYTAGSNPTVVDIASLDIGGVIFNDLTTTFAKELLQGYEYNMTLRFGNASDLTDNNPPGLNVYVGAFWKASQTGERLIRIPRLTNGTADGAWNVVVVKGADWIVLDTIKSGDNGVWTSGGPAINGNDANFDAQNAVGGLQTTVSSVMHTGNPNIYFRIGLRTSYNPTSSAPARYGMLLLTYGNNNYRQRIWIRQGEEADYMMRPGALDPGVGIASRSTVAQFVPYNLTVASTNLNGPVRNSYGSPPGSDPAAVFTDYPSQAGALFQWANTGSRTRFAWDAFDVITPKPWDYNISTAYWVSLINDHETCPYGYARPNDGSITSSSSGSITNSEIRQSLWLNPQTTSGSDIVNSAWGYYADGFFDRREITTAAGTYGGVFSSVSVTDEKNAHIGRIFFNKTTSASLFFPAAGYRDQLSYSGAQARYLSSSLSPNLYGWNTFFNSGTAQMDNPFSSPWNGFSVRCVVCVPFNNITVSAYPGTTVTAGTRVTLTANLSPSNATNAHYQWQKSDDGGTTFYDIPGAPNNYQYRPVITLGSSTYRVLVTNCGGTLSSFPHISITGTMPPDNLVDNPNIDLYAGAFWRAGEKGERVIRFNVGASNLENVGVWSVDVAQYDPRWDLTHPTNPDGIVLATGPSTAPGMYTANPSNAESYPVMSNLTSISGNVDANGWIEFRIGLKETFSIGFDPTTPNYSSTFPARYATLLFLYGEKANGNAKVQKIYIRQGEGPDFLMRTSDPINAGGVYNRSAARRFSPYNLTMNNATFSPTGNWNTTMSIAQNAGILTDYPTKAGFMFIYPDRYVISPDNPIQVNGWNQNVGSQGAWNSTWETCPPGYRRPHDGPNPTAYDATGGIAGSEIRQSLWVTPGVGTANNTDNSVWGYYADGYFDRRQVVNALGGTNPGTTCAVATNSVNVAYKGRLFFNPVSHASLFFPSAGYRFRQNGELYNAGGNGYYRTTQAHSNQGNSVNRMWHLYFISTATDHYVRMEYDINSSNSSKSEGGSIRCVYIPAF